MHHLPNILEINYVVRSLYPYSLLKKEVMIHPHAWIANYMQVNQLIGMEKLEFL
jgi:hypothetical protein